MVLVVILGEPTAVDSEHCTEWGELAMAFLVGFDISLPLASVVLPARHEVIEVKPGAGICALSGSRSHRGLRACCHTTMIWFHSLATLTQCTIPSHCHAKNKIIRHIFPM